MKLEPIEIDGTRLEGGGQLVRLTVGLSAITRKPVRIINIRGRRPKPGLKDQHLTAVTWLAGACQAYTEGMSIGSQMLLFEPGATLATTSWWNGVTQLPDGTSVRLVDIEVGKGVGAVTLVLQAILPFLLFADCTSYGPTAIEESRLPVLLKLVGGTNTSFSPSVDYLEQVLSPNLALLGLPAMQLSQNHRLKRGYSMGRATPGEVQLLIHPLSKGASLSPIRFPSRGRITRVDVTLHAGSLMARKLIMQTTVKALAALVPDISVGQTIDVDSGHATRMSLMIVAHTASEFRLGVDNLSMWKIGKSADAENRAVQAMVRQVVDDLMDETGMGKSEDEFQSRCLDHHMEDQVPIYMALASGISACERVFREGKSSDCPSLHQQTAIWVLDQVLGVKFDENGQCKGIGLVAGEPYQCEL